MLAFQKVPVQLLTPQDLMPVLASFVGVMLCTPIVRSLALRNGIVDVPKADRWHSRVTPLMGGVALVIPIFVICMIFGPQTVGFQTMLAASVFLGIIGLVDDLTPLKPYQKLAAQLAAAAAMIYVGYSLPWTGSAVVNIALTVLWLVGITNAVNLLDNMDGLAGGIAAIAALFLAINSMLSAQPAEAVLLLVLAAGLLGFLVYNFHPASIFMGDCGSMFIGFFIASASLMSVVGGRSRSLLPVLAVPVLILLIPIFDTLLVTVMRTLAGKSIARGWNDHTSHRLVALGLSEKRAVLLLYGLAAVSGGMSLLVREMPFDIALAALGTFILVLTLLGLKLGDVRIFSEEDLRTARDRPLVALLFDLSFKRRIFEIGLDVMLCLMSYYLACASIHGTGEQSPAWPTFRQVISIVIVSRMLMFLALGVYRGLWRYISTSDAMRYGTAVALSTLLTAFTAKVVLSLPVAGEVLILDGIFALLLILGSRVTFLIVGQLMPQSHDEQSTRTLIYGAGDSGVMLLRMLTSDPRRNDDVLGFLDDDPLKHNRTICGLPVHGDTQQAASIITKLDIAQIIVASEKIDEDRVQSLVEQCRGLPVRTFRLRVRLEECHREPMMAAG